MGTQTILGRLMMIAVIATLAAGVILMWVVAGSHAVDPNEGASLEQRTLRAAAGDTPSDGDCFGSGHVTIAGPDPDRLSRLVKERGRNGRLEAGTEAAPDAPALAERTGGELIASEGDDAYVLYVGDGPRRVVTYSRFTSSEGDPVWIVTGTTRRISCGHNGD